MKWRGLHFRRVLPLCCLLACGCHQWFINDADREVARLIESRQRAAIGLVSDADVGRKEGYIGGGGEMYSMIPSPVDVEVPEAFRAATTPRPEEAPPTHPEDAGEEAEGDRPGGVPDVVGDEQVPVGGEEPEPLTLAEALAYAMQHARTYQTEKEILYLTALDLTLEQYLWTPRFVESVLGLNYTNEGQAGDFDQAFEALATFAVEQRLPYGGDVTARVISTLLRDIGGGVTQGESGQLILETRIPLLRGAGRVAYESRYQAERDLVYAVRAFERFRREFLTSIASDYFSLLRDKANIESAVRQAENLTSDYERDEALLAVDQIIPIEADRTRVSMLNAQNGVIVEREDYDTNLDFFKIRIGMSPEQQIDVVEEELGLFAPEVSVGDAIQTALKYRLDLLTVEDAVDDARRGVKIARNNLLPQVDFAGSVTMDTDPEHLNVMGYNTERTRWQAGISVEIPLERKLERNDYRAALIGLRQAERNYDLQADTVRVQVQRAIRRIARARVSLDIQEENIRVNEARADKARFEYSVGTLASNRDIVEAEDALRRARVDYADAVSEYRRAILEFLRDTGTLRVRDDGRWVRYDPVTGEPIDMPPAGGDVSSVDAPDMPDRAGG